ncbi:UNVERIFIED_ORG: hypothetical protein ABIB19_000198 [Arthrobacter sp. UYEF10]|uniref:hypothetical protein n=1 Tax=unclassified Arthrobacter TaxID=235627 RepID=UPI0033939CFF
MKNFSQHWLTRPKTGPDGTDQHRNRRRIPPTLGPDFGIPGFGRFGCGADNAMADVFFEEPDADRVPSHILNRPGMIAAEDETYERYSR